MVNNESTSLHGGDIYNRDIDHDFSVNLNVLPCPDEVVEAVKDAAGKISFYPDISQHRFKEHVAAGECAWMKYSGQEGLPGEKELMAENVIGGNGASELIVSILRCIRPKKVLLPVPCFWGYRHSLNMLDECRVVEYTLNEESDFLLGEDFLDSIESDVDAVILGNPNNPTGKCINRELMSAIVRRCSECSTSLIVDECFLKFAEVGASASGFIGSLKGLFVINAYTKLFSIPGVRVGYCLAEEGDIARLSGFLPEWNLSVFADQAGTACADIVRQEDYVKRSCSEIKRCRKQLEDELTALGIKVFGSDANFLLIREERDLYLALLRRGILIRDCSNFSGLKKGYYRVAVRDEKANETLISAIKQIIYEKETDNGPGSESQGI